MTGTRTGPSMLALLLGLALVVPAAGPAGAQATSTVPTLFPTRSDPIELPVLLGGVPRGEVVPEPLELTLVEAVRRALEQNLAMLIESEQVRSARSGRRESLAALLPELSVGVSRIRQQINLAASGFEIPGLPEIIGPFDVFDARLYLSAPLFDASALAEARGGSLRLRAAEHDYERTRALVVLASGSLYLRTLAAESRVEAIAAQVRTAEELHRLASDRYDVGVVPRIDVLRAEVRLEADRQRLIAAENARASAHLRLARAIGVPPGQELRLTDSMRYVATPPLTLEDAIERALAQRQDLHSQRARLEAALAERRSAVRERLPSLELAADVGEVGADAGDTGRSFQVVAGVRVPVFQGGRIGAQVLRADAVVRRAEAELADLEAAIEFQVRSAFLDVEASEAQVEVTRRRRALAEAQLTQAQDRFAAGVSNNVEVVQAQEALATAAEASIGALLEHSLAKGALARALGTSEQTLLAILAGLEASGGELPGADRSALEPSTNRVETGPEHVER